MTKSRVPIKSCGFGESGIFGENGKFATNMANFRQCRDKIFNEMAKRPFESGDFDENGDVDQNSEKSPKPYLQVK